MSSLSEAKKRKKQREISSNVVNLQSKCIFANARDDKDTYNKVCFNTKNDSHNSEKVNETDAGDAC